MKKSLNKRIKNTQITLWNMKEGEIMASKEIVQNIISQNDLDVTSINPALLQVYKASGKEQKYHQAFKQYYDKLGDGVRSPSSTASVIKKQLEDASGKEFEKTGFVTKTSANGFEYNEKVNEEMTSWSAKQRREIIHKTLNIPGYETNKSELLKNFYTLFDRYYSVYPDLELTNLYHYVFMTRPDLNIVGSDGKLLSSAVVENPIYESVYLSNKEVILSLSSHMSDTHDFIPVMTSRVESLQLPDYSLRTYSLQQPYTNYTMPYSSHAIASTTGGSFSLTLRETADLSLHKLFQVWTTYINDINIGKLAPTATHIHENIADYMVSVYDIICAPDGKTILFWVKYVGCLPSLVENSSLSFNLRGAVDNTFAVPFEYFLAETMNYHSLADFNINAGIKTNEDYLKMLTTYTYDVKRGLSEYEYGSSYGLYSKPGILLPSNNNPFPMLCWKI